MSKIPARPTIRRRTKYSILTDLGVSDRVVKALLNKPQAALAGNPVPAAPPAAVPAPETPRRPARDAGHAGRARKYD